jgi:hypothetical protein
MNLRQQIVRQVLLETANQPFEYGTLDCVKFANNVITAMTGTDHSARFPYNSESEALQLLEQHGGLQGLFSEVFGDPSEMNELEDGDPVMVNVYGIGEMMGFMVSGSAMVKTERGTVSVPANRIQAGWHICHKQ